MKSPLTPIRFCLDLISLYLTQLWTHLSVIRQIPKQPSPKTRMVMPCDAFTSQNKINRTYMWTFVVYSIANIYGIFGLPLEAGELLSRLRHTPFLYWRQIYLREVWPQMDIMMCAVALTPIGLLLDFALKDVERKHLFVITNNRERVKLNGKDLSTYESTKLVAVYHRVKFLYKCFLSSVYTLGLFYCDGMAFLVTKLYFVSFGSLFFWVAAFPFILLFYFQLTIVNLTHIILSGICIQIRQQYLCHRFGRLLVRMTQKRSTERRLECVWLHYLTLNHTAVAISRQLEAFNRFYTNYLTVIFLEYTVVEVMLAYIVFFASAADSTVMFAQKCVYSEGLLEMTVLLFGLIQYCALVVKKNGQITRLNRQFAVHCLRHQEIYRLRVGQLLKIEHLQWPRLLHLYAFKVFGGSRITSKTFYAMAINISGFFLFVMKRIR